MNPLGSNLFPPKLVRCLPHSRRRRPRILDPLWLVPFFAVGAFLYSSVGHGGATVYLAILVLAGYPRSDIVTPVLVLNVLVASVGFVNFRAAGHLRPRLLWPLLFTSVPAAYLGARVPLQGNVEAIILGLALLAAAVRLLLLPAQPKPWFQLEPAAYVAFALPLGALLGFLAGATGIGGGIFLSPVLLFLGWATVKEAGAIAGPFIVLNSLSGLIARVSADGPPDWEFLAPLLVAVLAGGVVGSFLGAYRFPMPWTQRLLGLVLLVAAARTLLY